MHLEEPEGGARLFYPGLQGISSIGFFSVLLF